MDAKKYIDIKNDRNNAKIREIKSSFLHLSSRERERANFIHLTNETNDIFLPPTTFHHKLSTVNISRLSYS